MNGRRKFGRAHERHLNLRERERIAVEKFKDLGVQSKDWRPIGTFYNTGERLFFAENMNPKSYDDVVRLPWRWIRFRRWNSLCTHDENKRVLYHFTLNHLGHIGSTAVIKVNIEGYDQVLSIPPGYRLHMVDTIGGVMYVHDFRPIRVRVFEQAYRTQERISRLEALSESISRNFFRARNS